jgi:hypothetical protein
MQGARFRESGYRDVGGPGIVGCIVQIRAGTRPVKYGEALSRSAPALQVTHRDIKRENILLED